MKKLKINSILFIGSFLSKSRGTKGIAESLSERLQEDGIILNLVSTYENKLLRILDMLVSILVYQNKIIHIDVFSGPAFRIADISSRFAKLRKKEIILTLHGGKLIEFAELNELRIQIVFNRAEHVQTPSMYLQSYFKEKGFNVNYLPNSISLEKFPYSDKNRKPFSLLWVRAFTSIYNPDVPIRLIHQLLRTYPSATLTLVGPDKGCRSQIEALAQELGVSHRVDFVGSIKNDDLYRYYQSHSVYLNTTSYESFGVAVMEAASCGIPIVSNSVGEIPFIWQNGFNVLLVNDNNLDTYIKHITNIFESKELAENLSLNARNKAKQFSWENIKPMWIELLSR